MEVANVTPVGSVKIAPLATSAPTRNATHSALVLVMEIAMATVRATTTFPTPASVIATHSTQV